MYIDTQSITNDEDSPLNVFVEPCAFGVDILPGETYSFTSKSKVSGKFEVEKRDDGITLWGWQGTDILIKKGEEIIIEFDTPFPIIGATTKHWWQFWK